MSDKEIIIDGCEFQSDCIEYKDISYLKIMPICAIHKLSIACHDKVNKCKYYTLYRQLKQKEQECEEINLKNERLVAEKYTMNEEILKLKQALDEIEKYLDAQQKHFDGEDYHNLLDIINKVRRR